MPPTPKSTCSKAGAGAGLPASDERDEGSRLPRSAGCRGRDRFRSSISALQRGRGRGHVCIDLWDRRGRVVGRPAPRPAVEAPFSDRACRACCARLRVRRPGCVGRSRGRGPPRRGPCRFRSRSVVRGMPLVPPRPDESVRALLHARPSRGRRLGRARHDAGQHLCARAGHMRRCRGRHRTAARRRTPRPGAWRRPSGRDARRDRGGRHRELRHRVRCRGWDVAGDRGGRERTEARDGPQARRQWCRGRAVAIAGSCHPRGNRRRGCGRGRRGVRRRRRPGDRDRCDPAGRTCRPARTAAHSRQARSTPAHTCRDRAHTEQRSRLRHRPTAGPRDARRRQPRSSNHRSRYPAGRGRRGWTPAIAERAVAGKVVVDVRS